MILKRFSFCRDRNGFRPGARGTALIRPNSKYECQLVALCEVTPLDVPSAVRRQSVRSNPVSYRAVPFDAALQAFRAAFRKATEYTKSSVLLAATFLGCIGPQAWFQVVIGAPRGPANSMSLSPVAFGTKTGSRQTREILASRFTSTAVAVEARLVVLSRGINSLQVYS